MTLRDQLEQILQDLQLVWTETSLMLGAILLLVMGLIFKHGVIYKTIFLTVLLTGLYFNIGLSYDGVLLSKSLSISDQTLNFSSLILISMSLILVYPREHKLSAEFYFFLLSLIVGSIFIMKANSLLIAYLSIELVSFVSYILTNFSLKKRGHEAAIKYLLFGAVTSVIMVFGIAFIYGASATIYLSDWNANTFNNIFPQVGLLFLVFGLFFKISIFPFHIWTPAVYQSAPNDAVAVISIVPKLAGLVLLGRIVVEANLSFDHWLVETMLYLGMMTILVGTLGALRQSNTRRMISFGAIAHSGFMLPLVIMNGDTSRDTFWIYSLVYALMNLIIFYLIDRAEAQQIFKNREYKYAKKETAVGIAFTLVLISLVGLPPLAGFTAKFLLFSSLWEAYELFHLPVYLIYLIIALLSTVVALFYYLRIPYNIFISSNDLDHSVSIKFSNSTKIIATLFAIVLLLLFFVPELLMEVQQFLNNVHE